MGKVIKKTSVKREKNRLYFVDKSGDVSSVIRGKKGSSRKEAKVGVTKRKGYLYYVDKNGDIGEAKMARKGKKKSKK